MARLKVGILISGRGSNMRSLIEACKNPAYPAEVSIVISNNADAPGLVSAHQADIATKVISHKGKTRESFDQELHETLNNAGIEFICLAGFMRLLSTEFLQHWPNRIVNIHPSLLPAFPGLHAHEQAIAAGVKFSGCTVHFVVPKMDSGPIIAQAAVPVLPDDSSDDLAERILAAEHQLYPMALRLIAEHRIETNGLSTRVREPLTVTPPTQFNPII